MTGRIGANPRCPQDDPPMTQDRGVRHGAADCAADRSAIGTHSHADERAPPHALEAAYDG